MTPGVNGLCTSEARTKPGLSQTPPMLHRMGMHVWYRVEGKTCGITNDEQA